jgi:hypothetical protein
MLFSARVFLPLLALVSATVLAHASSPRRSGSGVVRCAQDDPSPDNVAEMDRMAEEARLNPMVRVHAMNATLNLDVYFHVISAGPSVDEGNLSNSTLMSQVRSPPPSLPSSFRSSDSPSR